MVVSATTVLLVLVLRSLSRKYRLPRLDMLMALIVVAVLAAALGWSHTGIGGKPAVAVVGDIPAGLPAPHVPEFKLPGCGRWRASALAIACLGLLEALAISKSIAHRTKEPLDYNRQCLAEGLANLGGSFFQCLPGSGSLTRSAINFQAGAVSRWSGVLAAGAVALVIILFGPSARFIPKPALAGILLVTAAGLIDWQRLRYALHASRYDAGLVMVTALAAVFVSVELSILIGVALSILMFVPRASRITVNELTVGGDRFLRDRQPDDPRCNRMIILDLEGELFFGASPDLERSFDELKQKINAGMRIVILPRQADAKSRHGLHGAAPALSAGHGAEGSHGAPLRGARGFRPGDEELAFPRLAAGGADLSGERRPPRFCDRGRGALCL